VSLTRRPVSNTQNILVPVVVRGHSIPVLHYLSVEEQAVMMSWFGYSKISSWWYVEQAQTFEQYGAEEACWAHNPKVGGSKPPTATHFVVSCASVNEALETSGMSNGLQAHEHQFMSIRLVKYCMCTRT
jgi:hypothetical protein